MANPKAAARPAQTPFPEADLFKHGIPEALSRRVRDMQVKGDPLLADGLLALPKSVEHHAHYAPLKALEALAEIFHSHSNSDLEARSHEAERPMLMVQAENMGYLMECIVAQMRGMSGLPTIDAALTLRQVSNHLEGEQA